MWVVADADDAARVTNNVAGTNARNFMSRVCVKSEDAFEPAIQQREDFAVVTFH
jgi:hypothetical protein